VAWFRNDGPIFCLAAFGLAENERHFGAYVDECGDDTVIDSKIKSIPRTLAFFRAAGFAVKSAPLLQFRGSRLNSVFDRAHHLNVRSS
jgi:hypothetical protein